MLERLTRDNLRGVWHALLTPWTDDDRLDDARYVEEIQSYDGAGLAGMYTGGTTGEFYAQDDATFERVTAITCEQAHRLGLPVQVGCTAISTRIVRQRIAIALDHGADAIQLGLPFWLALSDDEAVTFFEDVADAAGDVPIVFYQTMRNKRRVDPPLLADVAQRVPTLIGLKDTGGEPDVIDAEIAIGLSIFGGDNDLVRKMQKGGRGAYASVTGLNAKLVCRMYQLAVDGKIDEALKIEKAIDRLLMEHVVPMVHNLQLMDSALDRLMRAAGGGNVGLRCQRPYKSTTPKMVEELLEWCRENEPMLLEGV